VILSVDTTHEFGSLALTEGGEVVEEVLLHAPDGFGQVLFGHLASLLGRHNRKAAAMNCFAAAIGPGSFTGVRVGIACVKGLGEATGKPVVGVSNLAAIASFGSAPLRAAVMDARRGEVYGAVYDAAGAPVCDEVVMKFPAWLETIPPGVEFLSPDFAPFQNALAGTRHAAAKVSVVPRALAAAIGIIAHRSRPVDPTELDANYVRRSDAELLWKE
jgi:tRNA threonylcarbamoyladenosine biosynthesis protein TsaB